MAEHTAIVATWEEPQHITQDSRGDFHTWHPQAIDRLLFRHSLRTDEAGHKIRRMKEDGSEWEVTLEFVASALNHAGLDAVEVALGARSEVRATQRLAVTVVEVD